MKHLFPGKTHITILTQLSIVLCFFFAVSTTAYASCSLGACIGNQVTDTDCGYKDSKTNTDVNYCCTGNSTTTAANECVNLIDKLQANNTRNAAPAGGSVKNTVNPNGNCGDQAIDTALGCLSVDTKGFTISLLTFLAGTAGAISLVIMLVATIQIMTGGDNAEQVKKGKELFTSAITGLLFIIFSVTLLRIVAGDIIQLPGFN